MSQIIRKRSEMQAESAKAVNDALISARQAMGRALAQIESDKAKLSADTTNLASLLGVSRY